MIIQDLSEIFMKMDLSLFIFKAKVKKIQSDEYRLQMYQKLKIQDLLEVEGVCTVKGYSFFYCIPEGERIYF